MNKNGFSTEFKVGIFALIGMGFFLFLGVQFIQKSNDDTGVKYYLIFSFLNGLQQGSTIRYAGGLSVGKILLIEPFGDKAKLTIVINDKIKIDNRSNFSIMSNGLLGEKYVNVNLGGPLKEGEAKGEILKEGTTIEGSEGMGFDKLLSSVTDLAAEASKVMAPLAQILNKISETQEIPKLLADLRALINSGTAVVKENKENINKVISDMQAIIGKINSGKGSLGRILNDKALAQSLADTISSLDVLVSKLSKNPVLTGGSSKGR